MRFSTHRLWRRLMRIWSIIWFCTSARQQRRFSPNTPEWPALTATARRCRKYGTRVYDPSSLGFVAV